VDTIVEGELDIVGWDGKFLMIDIKILVDGNPQLIGGLDHDLAEYNINNITAVELPGGQRVCVSMRVASTFG
jgi:hypothetical protein